MQDKPNWQKIVKFLLEYYTQKEIENYTGINQSTISKLANNDKYEYRSPLYESGRNLIRMYNEALDKEKINE